MVKLNQNMSSPNDGEQHKDNNANNNIVKYRESNTDNILDLAEKHYENIVESLTNNAINTAATSLLLQSRIIVAAFIIHIPKLRSNDTYRIEESESFHNIEGDIAAQFDNSVCIYIYIFKPDIN